MSQRLIWTRNMRRSFIHEGLTPVRPRIPRNYVKIMFDCIKSIFSRLSTLIKLMILLTSSFGSSLSWLPYPIGMNWDLISCWSIFFYCLDFLLKFFFMVISKVRKYWSILDKSKNGNILQKVFQSNEYL